MVHEVAFPVTVIVGVVLSITNPYVAVFPYISVSTSEYTPLAATAVPLEKAAGAPPSFDRVAVALLTIGIMVTVFLLEFSNPLTEPANTLLMFTIIVV